MTPGVHKGSTQIVPNDHTTELLPLLKDPHCEFVLLRSCLALPKVMFLLRALDTSEHTDLLETFVSITRGALSRILGTAVSDQQWLQAKLPVAMGQLLRQAVPLTRHLNAGAGSCSGVPAAGRRFPSCRN